MASNENACNSSTIEERLLIDQCKKQHRQTTEAAQRAVKVVVITTEVARGTVVELHRQGQQADMAGRGVDQIHEEAKEAGSVLRFMRRFCCLAVATSCCSGCWCVDPHAHRDARRKSRVHIMQQQQRDAACQATVQHAAKQQQIDEFIRKANTQEPKGETAARDELLGSAGTIRAQHARQEQERLGLGLPEDDRLEVLRETRVQDECLDEIAVAVDALGMMGKVMGEEIAEQAPKLDRLGERAEGAQDQLRTLGRKAAQLTGQQLVESGGYGSNQAKAAAAAARYSAAAARAVV